MRITSKGQMYAMLRQGKLGNTLRTWDTEDEFLASGFRGRSSLRCKKPGVPFRHGLSFEETVAQGRTCFEGCQPGDFVYCEAAPDWECVFQGEVQRGLYGLDLFWSTAKANHRIAMRSAKQVHGLQALLLLRHHLDPSDYDDLDVPARTVRGPRHRVQRLPALPGKTRTPLGGLGGPVLLRPRNLVPGPGLRSPTATNGRPRARRGPKKRGEITRNSATIPATCEGD